jgi:hypothetical protein
MVHFYPQLLYIRGKSLSHKTKQPLFHLGILKYVNNFYKRGCLTLSLVAISVDIFTFYIPELANFFFGDSFAQWGIFLFLTQWSDFFRIFTFGEFSTFDPGNGL